MFTNLLVPCMSGFVCSVWKWGKVSSCIDGSEIWVSTRMIGTDPSTCKARIGFRYEETTTLGSTTFYCGWRGSWLHVAKATTITFRAVVNLIVLDLAIYVEDENQCYESLEELRMKMC